jgi:hypothetical protein
MRLIAVMTIQVFMRSFFSKVSLFGQVESRLAEWPLAAKRIYIEIRGSSSLSPDSEFPAALAPA